LHCIDKYRGLLFLIIGSEDTATAAINFAYKAAGGAVCLEWPLARRVEDLSATMYSINRLICCSPCVSVARIRVSNLVSQTDANTVRPHSGSTCSSVTLVRGLHFSVKQLINIWNSVRKDDVDFSSLFFRFKRTVQPDIFSTFLRCFNVCVSTFSFII